MLILTRRVGGVVRIGDSVAVAVLGINGKQVRLGIDAPRDVTVLREELYERDRQQPPDDPKKKPGHRAPGSVVDGDGA